MGIKFFLFVGLGGALGSVIRALISQTFSNYSLFATVMANLGGAFLIGCLVKWGDNHSSGELFRAFWIIGICGGFTTFSTFGYDLFGLLQRGSWIASMCYLLSNLLGTLIFIWLGFRASSLSFKFF